MCIRTDKIVLAKIKNIDKSWKVAHDWTLATGSGVKETDPMGYDTYIRKLCKYYFDLLDVMIDRSSSEALASTSDLYGVCGGEDKEDDSVHTFNSDGSNAFLEPQKKDGNSERS